MRLGRELMLCSVVCGAVPLSACHGDPNPAPTGSVMHLSAAPAVKRGPSAEELTSGMVEAVSPGSSTVPVAVKFALGARPVVGQPLEAVIAVMPQINAESVTLRAVSSNGLQLAASVVPIDMPSVEPGQVYKHSIEVTPTGDGLQLLELSVALKHDDMTETRTFSVPIIVATTAELAQAPSPAH